LEILVLLTVMLLEELAQVCGFLASQRKSAYVLFWKR
jgi:hypothetical protein